MSDYKLQNNWSDLMDRSLPWTPSKAEEGSIHSLVVETGALIRTVEDMSLLDRGSSFEGAFYQRGVIFLEAWRPDRTSNLLHEIAHLLVARSKGLQDEDNYGTEQCPSLESELDACLLHLSFLISWRRPPSEIIKWADAMNWKGENTSLRHTFNISKGLLRRFLPKMAVQAFSDEAYLKSLIWEYSSSQADDVLWSIRA